MKLIVSTLVAWVAGLATYFLAGAVIWSQRISPGDVRAAVFASLAAISLTVAIGYGPVMFMMRKYEFFRRRAWTFPFAGAGIAVLPLCAVGSLSGGRGAFLSPEALLFWLMFGVFGGVFGLGFWLTYVRRSA